MKVLGPAAISQRGRDKGCLSPFVVCGLVGICIDDALRRDAIAALPSRGRGVIDHRRPGYAPLRSVTDDAPSGLLHHMRDAAAQAASAP